MVKSLIFLEISLITVLNAPEQNSALFDFNYQNTLSNNCLLITFFYFKYTPSFTLFFLIEITT